MCWDFAELRDLCRKRGIGDSGVHQNALEWKRWRVEYHAEKSQEVWGELDQLGKEKGGIKMVGVRPSFLGFYRFRNPSCDHPDCREMQPQVIP